ncbi:MAG: hypothetical protein R6W48_11515 [Gaiellaceae bacterium]
MSKATDRAARERKQKIFVAVGGLALLGVLAIQVPKLMGGSPEAAPAPAATAAAPGAPVPSTGTPVATTAGSALPAVAQAEIRSFSFFDRKDPFVQQVVNPGVVAGQTPAAVAKPAGAKTPAQQPPTTGFRVDGKQGAAVTVIAVNGSRQPLETGSMFPADDPVFVLISEQPKTKSVTIGIAGGEYANGSKTIKLQVGKPVVLENTATGARYRIVLVSVGSGSSSGSAPAGSEKQPGPSPEPGP